jgi:hypothetical protein
MDDKRLDELLDDARKTYRVPPEPAVEAIWQRIDAEAFLAPGGATRRPTDRRFGAVTWRVAAASLVFGVLAGRWTSGVGLPGATEADPAQVTSSMSPVLRPYQKTTEELLGKTAVLLAALGTDRTSASFSSHVSDQAAQLLGTARMLLDSPAGSEPGIRALLLDLELTLAQVARLQPSRGETELMLINEAVAERDIVPRIRSAVVDLSGGGY